MKAQIVLKHLCDKFSANPVEMLVLMVSILNPVSLKLHSYATKLQM